MLCMQNNMQTLVTQKAFEEFTDQDVRTFLKKNPDLVPVGILKLHGREYPVWDAQTIEKLRERQGS
jgi:hypothetical protein